MFYGNGVVLTAAAACVVGGLLLIPAVFLTSVQWTGTAIQGHERGGLVYYTYRGRSETIDKVSRFRTDTVYLDPKHPTSSAQLGDNYTKAFDIGFACLPFIAAGAVLAYGFRRREPIETLTWPVEKIFDPTGDS